MCEAVTTSRWSPNQDAQAAAEMTYRLTVGSRNDDDVCDGDYETFEQAAAAVDELLVKPKEWATVGALPVRESGEFVEVHPDEYPIFECRIERVMADG
jgi:hypothetical protein